MRCMEPEEKIPFQTIEADVKLSAKEIGCAGVQLISVQELSSCGNESSGSINVVS